MKPKILRVGVVQQACDDNRDHNLRTSETAIREAAASGAQLVLLQELHTGPYFCQHESTALFDLAESIPGPSTEFLGGLARDPLCAGNKDEFHSRPRQLTQETQPVLTHGLVELLR